MTWTYPRYAQVLLSIERCSNLWVKVEAKTIGAFIELVTKLNESAFKPLFRRLFDWAFAGKHVEYLDQPFAWFPDSVHRRCRLRQKDHLLSSLSCHVGLLQGQFSRRSCVLTTD